MSGYVREACGAVILGCVRGVDLAFVSNVTLRACCRIRISRPGKSRNVRVGPAAWGYCSIHGGHRERFAPPLSLPETARGHIYIDRDGTGSRRTPADRRRHAAPAEPPETKQTNPPPQPFAGPITPP